MEILDKSQQDRKYIRSIAKQVVGECRCIERNTGIKCYFWARLGLVACLLVLVLALFSGCAAASTVINEPNIAGYSLNQWCKAIYIAEGGDKTRHPYGILAHYRHTTPLEACKNTIRHKYSNWKREGQHGTFLAYLGAKYCPVGCDNDNGSNKNWISNVSYWLKKG